LADQWEEAISEGSVVRHLPTDPTAPREPIRLPRSRPGVVTLAAVLMLGGAAVGFLNGCAMIVASARIGEDFRLRAIEYTGVSTTELDDVTASVQALFLFSGMVGAGFAVVVVALAVGVLRGNLAARVGTVAMIGLSLACAAIGGLGTLGASGGAAFVVTLEGADVDLGDPLSEAIPGWLASLTGGLGCLQGVGYIAVIILLFLPAANAYFRRRPGLAPPAVDPFGRSGGPTR